MSKKFAWSYSVLSMFEQCPKKYYHIKVKRDVKDLDSGFSADGKAIHEAMYARVMQEKPLPLPYRQYERIASRFANAGGEKHGEIKLALNKKLEQVDFFAPDVWVRAVIDLIIVKGDEAIIVDWKTGKKRPDFDQLYLTAICVAQMLPEVSRFSLVYVWLKENDLSTEVLHRDDMTELWAEYIARVKEIQKSTKTCEFPAKPSPLCKWCPVKHCPEHPESKANGTDA